MSKEKISGSEALMRSLEHEGVKTLFGYPGGAIMPVFDALYDHRDRLNHILVRHEQGAAHAAQGFARVSGKVGVCLVTSGPGATNTITGIADAMIDSTPIVVIAGQVGAGLLGTDAFQEVDLVGITQPITKWSYQIRRAEDVPWAVARAFYIARSGRPGPVVLDFAKNAQVDKMEYAPVTVDYIRSYQPVPDMDMEAIREAADLINAAERPLVLVGQGVELGNAQAELRAFIEKAGLPAGRTLLGLSALPSDHPLNKGMLGMHGNLGPNINTNKCDVLIAVGMRFDDRVTGNVATYAPQAKIIHFDIDPAEIDKNIKKMLENDQLLTMDEFFALWSQWLEEKYMNHVHSELKKLEEEYKTPMSLFQNGDRYFKPVPPKAQATMLMMESKQVRVYGTGIRMFGNYYRCVELANYIDRYVNVKYDPEDITSIYVFNDKHKLICEAQCQELLLIAPQVKQEALEKHIRMQKQQLKHDREKLEEANRPFTELNDELIGFDPVTGGIPLMLGKNQNTPKARVVSMPDDRTYRENDIFRKPAEKPRQESKVLSMAAAKALRKIKAIGEE